MDDVYVGGYVVCYAEYLVFVRVSASSSLFLLLLVSYSEMFILEVVYKCAKCIRKYNMN